MKIVVFEFDETLRHYYHVFDNQHEIVFEAKPLNNNTVSHYKEADIITTFVHSTLSRSILEQFTKLEFIATRSTGFDHIDLNYCQENGIQVSNVPTYGEKTVAEHVFALLLSISRKIPETISRTRQGNFSQEGLQGFDLNGRTIGVIGTGNIGTNVVKIAKGFSMSVLAYDINPNESIAKTIGFDYVTLPRLLEKSDIISLHVPANQETDNLLSEKEFSMMRDGVILINTARGSVINVKSLIKALDSGKVGAVGLDVLPEESVLFKGGISNEVLIDNKKLLEMENVFFTPHNAFNTQDAVQRIQETTIFNIKGFCEGRAPNLINLR